MNSKETYFIAHGSSDQKSTAKIHINAPYKIIPPMLKHYQEHYMIPAAQALIVPVRLLGDEVSCDIRWMSNNELQILRQRVFVGENLMPLNPLADDELYTLWQTTTPHF